MSLVLLHPNILSVRLVKNARILQYADNGLFTKHTLTDDETTALLSSIEASLKNPANNYFVDLKSVKMYLPTVTGKVYVQIKVYNGRWDIFNYISTLTEQCIVSAWVTDTMDMIHPLLKRSINQFWRHTQKKWLSITCTCGHQNRVKVLLQEPYFNVCCTKCQFAGVYSVHKSTTAVEHLIGVYGIPLHVDQLQPMFG